MDNEDKDDAAIRGLSSFTKSVEDYFFLKENPTLTGASLETQCFRIGNYIEDAWRSIGYLREMQDELLINEKRKRN